MRTDLIVTTSATIEGHVILEYLGVVRGIAVRIPTISQGLQALGGVLGGDLEQAMHLYEEVCEDARNLAYRRMVQHAQERGADAIVAMRYDATDLGERAAEVLAYGTAVKLKFPEVLPAPTSPPA
jgi:uncharacterized protein YbjQ (UPF0145 family)